MRTGVGSGRQAENHLGQLQSARRCELRGGRARMTCHPLAHCYTHLDRTFAPMRLQEKRLAVSVIAVSPTATTLAVSQQRFTMCVDALTLRLFNKVRDHCQWR